ncbi:MAG: serine/threonine protein kinase [Labilithrix sp.]|nr:serine/threonine protein kinase [Labilithrix sp.]
MLPKEPIAGKYEVRGVLGEGGTGIVYDARRVSDGSPVALKVMHPQLAGDQQIRGRFQREATILSRLHGPNICPILDVGEVEVTDGLGGQSLLYMALAKIDGPTLERVLVTDRPIDMKRGLDIMLEVCAALQTAHAQGVIHRDLKPANVILRDGLHVVVVDFGMSKIVAGSAGGTTNLTAHNMVFGTPEYMSPEQARGDELDVRCDVYAAGVMLYEMLTGAPPFTGSTPLNVLTEHLSGELTPPSKRARDASRVTPALESVVMYALARDREDRYPSASALAAAIRHARAVPDDVHSLRPSAFSTSPEGTDAFALTMPALGSYRSEPPRRGDAVPSDTMLAAGQQPTPPLPSQPPSTKPSPRARVDTARAPRADVARVKDPSGRLWLVLWVVAGILSIAVGVYIALR